MTGWFLEWIERLKALFFKYERWISAVTVGAGFVIDNLTLRRIDLLAENIVILVYLAIAGMGIVFVHIHERFRLEHPIFQAIRPFFTLPIQFAFGALFSALLVFYVRSASFASSWFFILLLLGLLVGNEFFRARYEQLVFQVSVYFIAVYAYMIFLIPVLVHRIGALVFIGSTLASVVLIVLFLTVLISTLGKHLIGAIRMMVVSVGGIVIAVNFLYFTNVIPPIPLSLDFANVYHEISRTGEGYHLKSEEYPWYIGIFSHETLHIHTGAPIYAFSSVFAPTDLRTQIIHRWDQKIDGEWVTTSRVAFPILGGREEGYRGFSRKDRPGEGKWRVVVETNSGQRLGAVRFNIAHVSTTPRLTEETR